MKMIRCHSCKDVVALIGPHTKRHCACCKSSGKYLEDGRTVEIEGPCDVLCLANSDLNSIQFEFQDDDNLIGYDIRAWAISDNNEWVKRIGEKVEVVDQEKEELIEHFTKRLREKEIM